MTMTENQKTTPRRGRKPKPAVLYTTQEVLDYTGLSFRVLDYWLRTKVIVLSVANTPGSGHSRVYTQGEVEAIKRLADRYRFATGELRAIRSGEAWMGEAVADASHVA